MKQTFRSVFLLALPFAAMSAHAADAFNNVGTGYNSSGYVVSPVQQIGFQFTSALTGDLTGFKVAINEYSPGGPYPFTLSLYANAPGEVLGTLLGAWGGTSTGQSFDNGSALASVPASGPRLFAGQRYWLIPATNNVLAWGAAIPNTIVRGYDAKHVSGDGYANYNADAFSVQVGPVNPTPEPSALAALGFGAVTVLRRRRRS